MTERVQVGGLQVAKVLFDFVNNEAIPGTGVSADTFWTGAEAVINDLAPKNKALLAKRDELQAKIDGWHQARAGQAHDAAAYKAFHEEIGYLLPE
ncbi:malate synthase G, partial [Xanthomonas citri pv. citri]|nr:malate synthase G [Xanthomonas citri pv. citri]